MHEYEFVIRVVAFLRAGKTSYNRKRVRFFKEDDAYALTEAARILEQHCVRRDGKVYQAKAEKLLRLEEVPLTTKLP